MMRFINRKLAWAVVVIPLQTQGPWQVLSFKKIAPNQVTFTSDGLRIAVQESASPVIYPLPKETQVTKIRLKGRIDGSLSLKDGIAQGQGKNDDFLFRLGVVLKGEKHLSKIQSWVAPDWIKKLYSLAPSGVGIDHIEFFNVVSQSDLVGKTRLHPKSELLSENFSTLPGPKGEFTLEPAWVQGADILALWLASDGDDSHSRFSVFIDKIELETK